MDQPPPAEPRHTYLLDANVFMTACHHYYARDLCPGFWACLEHYSREGRLLSIDRVRQEIISPNELVDWVDQAPENMFAFSGELEVVDVFSAMQIWVQENDQFLPAAKDEFARVADGWIAAYAKVHDFIVVTNEVANTTTKRRVPLPSVCQQFSVVYQNPFQMLRGLGVNFDWN